MSLLQNSKRCFLQLTRNGFPVLVAVLVCFLGFNPERLPAQDKKTPSGEYEKRIYVPSSELDSVFGSDKKGILLTLEKFEDLVEKAEQNSEAAPESVDKLVVKGMNYEAQVQNDTLVINTDIQLHQYQEGWQTVKLPLTDLYVEQAVDQQSPVLMGRSPEGLHLFHQKSGPFSVQLKLIAPLNSLGSDQLASFRLIPSSNSTFQLTLPGEKFLYVDGLKSTSPSINENKKIFKIEVGGKENLELRITDKKVDQVSDALIFAQSVFQVSLNPGELNWQAMTRVRIFGQQLEQLKFKIPSRLEITEIESHGLETWKLIETEDEHLEIELKYRQGFSGTREIRFKGIQSLNPDEEWYLPTLVMNDVTSHTGQIIVSHPVNYRFQTVFGDGYELNSSEGKKPDIRNETEFHRYSFWNEEFEFGYKMKKKARLPQLNVHQVMQINEKGIDITYLGKIYPVSSPVYEFNLEIPLEWEITSVSLDDAELEWQVISDEAGVRHIRFLFENPIPELTEKTIYLSAHHDPEDWPLEENEAQIKLPDFIPSGVDRVSGSYIIRSEEDMEVVPKDIKGMEPAVLTVEGARLGYLFKQKPVSGLVQVSRKPARITTENLSVTRLDRDSLRTHLESRIKIEGGGVRQLEVAVSEDAGTDIRFYLKDPAVRIIEQQKMKTMDQKNHWMLRFNRRVKGEIFLVLDTETERNDKTEFSPHEMFVQNVERQNGYVVIEARQEQRLSVMATTKNQKPLEDVDPAVLPQALLNQGERIVASYQYIEPGYQVIFSEELLDRVSVPTAICHESHVETVLNPGGESQHYAKYEFVAIGVQSLLINIPEKAELWATLIDGKPVEVRRTEKGYELALTSVTPAEKRRNLELFYSTEEKKAAAFGTLGQSPPTLSAVDGLGTAQPMETLKQNWSVHHPPTTMLVSSNGTFVSQSKMDRSGLMSWIRDQIDVVNKWSITNKVITLLVTVLVIVVIIKFFKRFRDQQWVYVLGGFALMLIICIPLLLPKVQQARKSDGGIEVTSGITDGYTESSDDFFVDDYLEKGVSQNGQIQQAPEEAESEELSSVKEEDVKALGLSRKPAPKPVQAGTETSQVKRDRGKGTRSGGRLSVAVQFQAPQNWPQKDFQYLGNSAGETEELLKVQYEDKTQSFVYRNIAIVAVVLICWLIRNRPGNIRMICVLLCMTLPLILMQIVPFHWYSILDGLFYGSLLGLLLLVTISLCSYSGKKLDGFRNRFSAAHLLLIGLVLFSGNTLQAGDKGAEEKGTVEKKLSPEIKQVIPDRVLINKYLVNKSEVPEEKMLVIPYDEGEDPLESDQVYIPYEEYLQLWNQAHPENPLLTEPPVRALVAGAVYHAKISDSEQKKSISVKGRIVFQNLTDSSVAVTLPFKPPAIQKALLNGKPVSIQVVNTDKGKEFQVILKEGGNHVLDIDFDIPAEITGKAGQFSVSLQQVPSGRLSFDLPEADLKVSVSGIQAALIQQQDGDQPSVSFPIDRGGNFQVNWQPQQSSGTGESTIHVVSKTGVRIDSEGLHLDSFHTLRIRQGSLNRLEYQVPAELMIMNVEGQDVGGWKITGSEEDRKLEIFFRREIKDQTGFQVHLYKSLKVAEEEEFSIGRFGPLDITHETGELGIYISENLEVKINDVSELKKVDKESFQPESGQPVSGTLETAYRYTGFEFSLDGAVSRKVANYTTHASHGVVIEKNRIQYAHRYELDIKDSPIDQYSLIVPFGYQVTKVESSVLGDWVLQDDEFGDRVLMVSFSSPQKGKVIINIAAEGPVELIEESLSVILPFSLALSKTTSELGIWIDDSLQAVLEEKGGWKQIDPQELPGDLNQLKKEKINYALKTSAEEVSPVTFSLSDVRSILQGSSASIITLTDVLMNYQYAIKWKIITGSENQFCFIIPSIYDQFVEVQGTNIRQVKQSRFTPQLTRWEILTQEPVKNEYFTLVNITLPPPSSGKVTPVAPMLQYYKGETGSEYEDIDLQQHYYVLVNQSQGQLSTAGNQNSSPVDSSTLPIVVDKELLKQALAVEQFNQPGAQVVYAYQKKVREVGLPASVNQARLISILEMDGSWRMQAVYRMKNLKRQFLAVRLPENSRLLSAFVAREPTRPSMTMIKNQKVYLLPLPKTSEVDLAFDVHLTLSGELDKKMLPDGFNVGSKELVFPAPVVISQQDDPDYGIPVARTDWTVFLPEELELVSSDNHKGMNLENTDQDLARIYRERALLTEAKELFTILENEDTNSNLMFRCWSNLEQIEQEIRLQEAPSNRSYFYDSKLDSITSNVIEENNDLRNDVLKDYSKNRSIIKNVDQGNNTITFSRPQRVSGLELEDQLDFFETQSSNIISSNTFQGVQSNVQNNNEMQSPVISGRPNVNDRYDNDVFGFELNQPADEKEPSPVQEQVIQQRRSISNVEQRNQAVEFDNELKKNLPKIQSKLGRDKNQNLSIIDSNGLKGIYIDKDSDGDGIQDNISPVQDFGTEFSGEEKMIGGKGTAGGFGGGISGDKSGEFFGGTELSYSNESKPGKSVSGPSSGKGWSTTGGISLEMNLPQEGNPYYFQKVNGDPKLSIQVRSRKSVQYGISAFWLIAWVIIAVVSILALTGKKSSSEATPILLTLAGVTLFICFGGLLSGLGFVIFLVGGFWLTSHYFRQTSTQLPA